MPCLKWADSIEGICELRSKMQDERNKTINFSDFVSQLKKELLDLPGEEAQYRMARATRMKAGEAHLHYPDARLSAVLILFYPLNDSIYTVLIQRPTYDGVHSGQVAFPGGKKEPGDVDLIATALREAHEEVGIDPANVEVLGPLTQLYIPPSNFLVTPVVGVSLQQPKLVSDQHEVQEIMETNIALLVDDSLTGYKKN